jgi:hypothetical protein
VWNLSANVYIYYPGADGMSRRVCNLCKRGTVDRARSFCVLCSPKCVPQRAHYQQRLSKQTAVSSPSLRDIQPLFKVTPKGVSND